MKKIEGKDLDPRIISVIDLIQRTEMVTTRIHGLKDEREIFKIVEEELGGLKHNNTVIFLLSDDRQTCFIRVLTVPAWVVSSVEKLLGIRIHDVKINVENSNTLRRVRDDGDTYTFRTAELIDEIFPRPMAFLAAKISGYDKKNTIVSPIRIRNEVIGILGMDTPELADFFILSVKNLALHISAALELAEENDRRNRVEQDLKESEMALKRAKEEADAANRAKSEFLANMSHEIRTPMNAVIGFGDLLKNTSLTEQQKDYVDTICSSGELLISLINDILDISKIESQKITLEEVDFDLEYLIGSVLKILRQRVGAKPVELTMRYSENVPRSFKGDPTRIRQIIMNLASNSIKFTDAGNVTVSVEPVHEDTGTGNAKSELRIRVKDTGIGIPKEKQSEIFEAFTQVDSSITRKYGGTGLGLAITRSLVAMMGGSLAVESEEGKGATFIFTLQLAAGAPAVEEDIVLVELENLKGKKVLIVDDNAESRMILQSYCASIGMEVAKAADSASNALEWLAKTTGRVDVILSDIMMPVMDGFAFARRLRENDLWRGIKLIALTSDALPGSTERSGQAGFDAYLSKPFTRKELYDILCAVFGDARRDKRRIITRHTAHELMTKGISVLVVEDNPLNQKLMGILLTQMECAVETANNGREAVNTLSERTFDIILMDIQMPVMDGFDATRVIRQQLRVNTPIIALTARVFKEDEEKCMEVGMNDFLIKPVEAGKLKEKMIRWARS